MVFMSRVGLVGRLSGTPTAPQPLPDTALWQIEEK